jgi:two-component SAPR family response regulator
LITDIDLGSGPNGIDVASKARHLWPDVRIILISGLSANHTGQSIDPRDRYIQKPFSGDRLMGEIERMTNVYRAKAPQDGLLDPNASDPSAFR